MIRQTLAILTAKLVWKISTLFNLGAGGTWPGELALTIDPSLLSKLAEKVKGTIVIAGTNGKTTTALMVNTILEEAGFKVISNSSGANLVNGVVSSLIQFASLSGNLSCDFAILEADENALPAILDNIKPKVLVCLNLFRDQLDRYGEVDVISEKWQKAIRKLPQKTELVLNSDDPQIAFLGKDTTVKTIYFGLNDKVGQKKTFEHATDSIFCPDCGSRLKFSAIYYSHLGWWQCRKCGLERPSPQIFNWDSPLPGLYNKYNTQAAAAIAKVLKIDEAVIKKGLKKVRPAFGRQEEMEYEGRMIKLMLSKNPAGFNESLRTVLDLEAKNLLIVLNDRIPDGRDISWIWDVDFEMIPQSAKLTLSGDRVYDLGLRIKYAGLKYALETDFAKAIKQAAGATKTGEKLFTLATYSAMLDIRKIISGKKIL